MIDDVMENDDTDSVSDFSANHLSSSRPVKKRLEQSLIEENWLKGNTSTTDMDLSKTNRLINDGTLDSKTWGTSKKLKANESTKNSMVLNRPRIIEEDSNFPLEDV